MAVRAQGRNGVLKYGTASTDRASRCSTRLATTSALALVPAFAGMLLGQAIRSRIHPDVFRRWFFAGLLLLGLYMVGRTVAALTA